MYSVNLETGDIGRVFLSSAILSRLGQGPRKEFSPFLTLLGTPFAEYYSHTLIFVRIRNYPHDI